MIFSVQYWVSKFSNNLIWFLFTNGVVTYMVITQLKESSAKTSQIGTVCVWPGQKTLQWVTRLLRTSSIPFCKKYQCQSDEMLLHTTINEFFSNVNYTVVTGTVLSSLASVKPYICVSCSTVSVYGNINHHKYSKPPPWKVADSIWFIYKNRFNRSQ